MFGKFYPRPYVGVCDVASAKNILELSQPFQRLGQPLYLKAGVTMTRKVLWGIPSKWEDVCPPIDGFKEIFSEKFPGVFNVVHYADYDGVDLLPSLEKIIRISGSNLQGVQFDMIWPDVGLLEQCKKLNPNLQFILQVGTNALDQVDNNPLKLWKKFEPYGEIVERVLLDKSMGKGISLSAQALIRYVDILYERMKEPGVVVAGGLGPDTLESVEPLMAMYPMLSIDAQGQIHQGGKTLSGPIDISRAKEYVSQAVGMHIKYNPLG